MSALVTATRYHDFSCGHRVVGHESKCAHLHGHNYRVHFTCHITKLDSVGRVLDFGSINTLLCQWLEMSWDHKFLAWEDDQILRAIDKVIYDCRDLSQDARKASRSIVWVPFNPTAENMACYLLHEIGPARLEGTGVELIKVVVEETRKCSAAADLVGG